MLVRNRLRNYSQKKGKSKVSRTYEMSRTWSNGVLEYWGIKRRHPTFRHYSSTPVLQHSEIDKQLMAHTDYFFWGHRSGKLIVLLLMVVFLSACASTHQSRQAVSDGASEKTGQREAADQATIASLQEDLAALDAGIDKAEAGQVAQTAVRYSYYLAEQYELVRPAVFHNVLVRIGLKERGLCHHWATDLMEQLELLDLRTYQLYWGVAHRGSELREHNSVVIAARGKRFEEGIVLDPWRNSGALHWVPVKKDTYPWQPRPRHEW